MKKLENLIQQKQKDIDNYQVMLDSLCRIDEDYERFNDKFQEI